MRVRCAALLLLLGCRPGAAGSAGRPPVPALPNLPGDTLLTVELPNVPREDVLYYRTIVGVIFDDTTSGTTIRSLLERYDGRIIGGVRGDDEYFIRIPDPGATFAALDAVVQRLQHEPGVRLARMVHRRWRPIIDGRVASITGRVVDPNHVPIAGARVTVPLFHVEVTSDSTGAFRVPAQRSGCAFLRVRQIGFGGTAVSVRLERDSLVDIGEVPLRPAPIPEWRLLYVQGCTPSDSTLVDGLWGVDTVRLAPP